MSQEFCLVVQHPCMDKNTTSLHIFNSFVIKKNIHLAMSKSSFGYELGRLYDQIL